MSKPPRILVPASASAPAPAPAGAPAADPPLDPAIVQRAAEWMARLWSDQAGAEDQAACAAWRAAHPDHEYAWQQLQLFESKLDSVPASVARRALREPADPDPDPDASGHAARTRRRALQLLSVGVAVGGLAYLVRGSDGWQLATAELRSASGEVRAITLPDGTRLELASASAVDLRFTDSERLIVLRAGEIQVSTAPDPWPVARPLRVQSRQGTVRALGTRFTVRQHDDACRVRVFEGAVEIRPVDAPATVVRLDAGQGASFSTQRVGAAGPVQDSEAAWSRGLLVADNMRLDDFLAELARYRPGLLRCEPAVAGLRVSGVFPLRATDRALHNLTLALPVSISYRTRYWVTVQAKAAKDGV